MKYTFTDTRTNEESEIFDSFAKLKNYFEPDENELPEEWDKWEQIDDLDDLKEFLREFDNGVEFFEFKEFPEDIDILMADGCTKEEAKKNLKDGAIVFYDLEENPGKYLEEWAYLDDKDGEEKFTDEVKKMVETKTPIPDWGAVEVCGKWYFIEYCL